MKKILLLMFALVTSLTAAFAAETTVTWSAASDWTVADNTASYTQSPFTIFMEKGAGSSNAPVVSKNNDARAYAFCTVKVSTTGGNMTQIVFNLSSQGKKRLTEITASEGTVVVDNTAWTVTWTGDAASVTFTVGEKATYGTDEDAKAGQLCYDSVVITAADGGSTVEPEPEPEPTPAEKGTIFSEKFNAGLGDFTTDNVTMDDPLTYVWIGDSNYGYAKASAYVKGAYSTESWLISPAIDLSNGTECELVFDHAANYYQSLENFKAACSLKVREVGGDWADLAYTGDPTGTSWTFASATADLSAYDGKSIQLAFVYTSTESLAGTWEVKNLVVQGVLSEPVETVNAPVADNAAGTYMDEVTVTLTADEGCTIYYTLDGTKPSAATSAVYTEPIVLTETTTIMAIAVNANGTESEAFAGKYNIKESPKAPENGALFNFNANKWGLPISDGSTNYEIADPITEGDVTLAPATLEASTPTRMWNDASNGYQLRTYKGSTLTFTVPDGVKILQIVFNTSKINLSADSGTFEDGVWTGEAQSVTFTGTGTTNINYITVTCDTSTGIAGVQAVPAASKAVFSLDGRRLSAPVKGINIIGGKKVLVK